MPVAIFKNSRLGKPEAIFNDMLEALHWGREAFGGAAFIVRVWADEVANVDAEEGGVGARHRSPPPLGRRVDPLEAHRERRIKGRGQGKQAP